MRSSFVLLAVLGLACVALPARAGLDQRCLHGCLAGGETARVCISGCSFDERAGASAADAARMGTSHDVFVPPLPLQTGEVAPPSGVAGTLGTAEARAFARHARAAEIVTEASRLRCATACVRNAYAAPLCHRACDISVDPLVPDSPWLADATGGRSTISPPAP